MSARDNILRRIRDANRQTGYIPAGREPAIDRLRHPVRGPLPSMNWEPVARFRQRCLAMMSTVDDVGTLTDVPAAAARYLRTLKLPEIGVCWPEFAALDWAGAGLKIEPRPAMASDKVGITGTYCALAENGTLMLLSGEGTSATSSLLPDTHIAIVPASRIVSAMEDGWDLLRREHGTLPRQVNFVSGPSRTADIELTLVLGAHGPIRVHVIIVAG
ncbi:MAG: lactate utilization protein C [Burkholderiales bacterium]|jgi:L-lactate dehydrogenase complex protein LldG